VQEYSVILSESAEEDLDDIVEYLSNFSPTIARRYYDDIMTTSLSLSFMPQRCSFVRDERLRNKGYRYVFIRNYTVFFVIDEQNCIVDIRAIMYSRREYTALL
jgi:plasmid stabilization system protein ParE